MAELSRGATWLIARAQSRRRLRRPSAGRREREVAVAVALPPASETAAQTMRAGGGGGGGGYLLAGEKGVAGEGASCGCQRRQIGRASCRERVFLVV